MNAPRYTHRGELSGVRPHPDFVGPIWPFSLTPAQLDGNRRLMLAGVEAEKAYLAKRAILDREHEARVEAERQRQAKRAKRRDSIWRMALSTVFRVGTAVFVLAWLVGVLSRL